MSKIEWTDETWNPVTGCTKTSAGCKNCYAERMVTRFAGRNGYPAVEPFAVTEHPDRLEKPLSWKKSRRVFVCSMGDLFHPDVTDNFICRVFDTIAQCQEDGRGHVFQILTKRPVRMREFFGKYNPHKQVAGVYDDAPLPNVWLGVSVENQETADERIPHLLDTPAVVRFVSVEPLLAPVDLTQIILRRPLDENDPGIVYDTLRGHLPGPDDTGGEHGNPLPKLDWVIVGGESGAGARPMHPGWARTIRDQCVETKTAFFFKQWGEWGMHTPVAGGDLGGDRRRGEVIVVHPQPRPPDGRFKKGAVFMARVGKKTAGRELGGRTWDEMPEAGL